MHEAPESGASADDSIRRLRFFEREWEPSDGLLSGSVRTGFSYRHDIQVLPFDNLQSDGLPPVNPADSGVSP